MPPKMGDHSKRRRRLRPNLEIDGLSEQWMSGATPSTHDSCTRPRRRATTHSSRAGHAPRSPASPSRANYQVHSSSAGGRRGRGPSRRPSGTSPGLAQLDGDLRGKWKRRDEGRSDPEGDVPDQREDLEVETREAHALGEAGRRHARGRRRRAASTGPGARSPGDHAGCRFVANLASTRRSRS